MNLLVAFTCALLLADEPVTDWPQFRGATGQGIAASSQLPVTWSDRRNILWKTPIKGLGYSSPWSGITGSG